MNDILLKAAALVGTVALLCKPPGDEPRYLSNWHKFMHYMRENPVHQGQFIVKFEGDDVPVNGLMCTQCGNVEVDDWPRKATHVSTIMMDMCNYRTWTTDRP